MKPKSLLFLFLMLNQLSLSKQQGDQVIPRKLTVNTTSSAPDPKQNIPMGTQSPSELLSAPMPINSKAPIIDNKSVVLDPRVLDSIQNSISRSISNRNLDDGMNGVPPLTILPPRIVDSEADAQSLSSIDPTSPQTFQMPSHHKKHHRGLNITPYMHIGNGYVDLAQSGLSPLGMAMSNPHLPSLSPFLPRMTPPPPLRIQIHDPDKEKGKSNVMSQTDRDVYDIRIKNLVNSIDSQIKGYNSEVQAQETLFKTQFDDINKVIETIISSRKEDDLLAKQRLEQYLRGFKIV